MTPGNHTRKNNRAGFTIIELMVGIALTAILTTVVYMTWNTLSTHTTVQKRRTVLRSESTRIVTQITSQLRRADNILHLDRNRVVFTMNDGSDTICYDFDGSELRRNDIPISFTGPHISVTDFTFHDDNSNDGQKPYLITCTLRMKTESGDTTSSQMTVFVRRAQSENSDNSFSW